MDVAATDIFNAINSSGQYPRQWVKEFITPVNKIPQPKTEDDLRPISITADLSRDYNKFLADWLLRFIKPRLDPGQMGGTKGGSTLHYLVLLFRFILSNTDRPDKGPRAVLTTMVDFSKGFTRICHNRTLIRLSDWGVPAWLLKIVASYLTNRTMIVRYKGVQSKEHSLPGGGPQGDAVGHILFLVEISDCRMDLPPPLPL